MPKELNILKRQRDRPFRLGADGAMMTQALPVLAPLDLQPKPD